MDRAVEDLIVQSFDDGVESGEPNGCQFDEMLVDVEDVQ
jgi:hypothetical protein